MHFKSLFGARWISFNCYRASHFDLNSCDGEQDKTEKFLQLCLQLRHGPSNEPPISSEQTCWGLIKFYCSSNSHLQTTFQWEHGKDFYVWAMQAASGGGIAHNQRKLKVTHLNLISRHGSIDWLAGKRPTGRINERSKFHQLTGFFLLCKWIHTELKAVGLMQENHLCETSTKLPWAIKRSLPVQKTLWTHHQLKKRHVLYLTNLKQAKYSKQTTNTAEKQHHDVSKGFNVKRSSSFWPLATQLKLVHILLGWK